MASKTFYNIPEEKKQRIISAAKREFSRVPLEKALISNIIKDAGIPRGSFYQYFENIEDLFVYIIDDIYKRLHHDIKEEAKIEGKTYFDAMKKKFYEVLSFFENGEERQFNINIYMSFINLEMKNSVFLKDIRFLKVQDDLSIIPEEILNMPYSKEFLGLIGMANLSCLNDFIFKDISKEKVYENYCGYLDYIRNTILKNINKKND